MISKLNRSIPAPEAGSQSGIGESGKIDKTRNAQSQLEPEEPLYYAVSPSPPKSASVAAATEKKETQNLEAELRRNSLETKLEKPGTQQPSRPEIETATNALSLNYTKITYDE